MRLTTDIHPTVGEVILSETENKTFEALAHDWFDEVSQQPEATAFDAVDELGQQARIDLPGLSDVFDELKTHQAWRAMVIHTAPPSTVDIGPTPDRYLSPEDNPRLLHDIHRQLILGMMGIYAYGYTTQQAGNIHNNIVATREAPEVSSAHPNELGPHIEDTSFNLAGGMLGDGSLLDTSFDASPDWLTLHFLRNPDKVPSAVFVPDWNSLPSDIIDTLKEPFYVNQTSPIHGGKATRADVPVSILYGPDDKHLRLRINTTVVELDQYTERQQNALKAIVGLTVNNGIDLPLGPGDIALVDNHRTPHGRRQYSNNALPRFDGKDRWQRRVIAADDASRVQQFEVASRIVDPKLLFHKLEQIASQ